MSTTVTPQAPAASDLFEKHRTILDTAVQAIQRRGFWTPFSELPSSYPEGATAAGRDAFDSYRDADFPLDQPGTSAWIGGEISPYGFALGTRYPSSDPDVVLAAMQAAMPAWRDAGSRARTGVCLEILSRLNARTPEIALAVMHTTGQAYGMAFQAGGPHAQDRGLEAVAYAYAAMSRVPEATVWEKPQGKRPPLRMSKRYTIVPRGLALVIGCNTFPTWNGYPGLFASLVTGNPVIVKPHPRAILPLAITVAIAREVLSETGFDPNQVCLAVEEPGGTLAATLAVRPEIRIIDFTGSSAFGDWLETHAHQAAVFTEKAGVNTVVIDSTDDYEGMLRNLAFSLSLYSGQMCTSPQNILVPAAGIETDGGRHSADEVSRDLAGAVESLLGEPARATSLLGGIVNSDVLARIERAGARKPVALGSRAVAHPEFPDAVVRTPVIGRLTADDADVYSEECFGPISYIITTANTEQSLDIWRRTLEQRGALTASVYSSDDSVLRAAEEVAVGGGVALSCNLTGSVYINQSAAFSDFHATGANPAANATLTDEAFVSSRFRVVQSRRHLASPDG